MKILLNAVLVLAVTLGASASNAQEQGHLNVKTVVLTEEVTVDDNGERQTLLVDASKVVPGDEVIYTVTFANTSDEPAGNVVITNPLADEMTYVVGSAFGPGSDIVFSADGGKSFATPEDLFVTEAGVERLANADDYTHIRWLVNNEIVAGAQGMAQFRARLK